MESSRLLMASIFSKISLDTLANFVLRLSSSSSTTAVSSPGASSVICRVALTGAVCGFVLGGLTEVSATAAAVVGAVVVVAAEAETDADAEVEVGVEAEAATVSVLGGSLVMAGEGIVGSWRGFNIDRKWVERESSETSAVRLLCNPAAAARPPPLIASSLCTQLLCDIIHK